MMHFNEDSEMWEYSSYHTPLSPHGIILLSTWLHVIIYPCTCVSVCARVIRCHVSFVKRFKDLSVEQLGGLMV